MIKRREVGTDMERLERKVKRLEATVRTLTLRCEDLLERIQMLSNAKIPDPRAPYSNFLLERWVYMDARRELDILWSALDDRIAGKLPPKKGRRKIKGVSNELLYGSGPPPLEDILQAIKTITCIEERSSVRALMKAVERQLTYDALCNYILPLLDA